MKKFFALLTALLLVTGCGESSEQNLPTEKVTEKNISTQEEIGMKIKIQIGDKIFDATLEDNPSTRELVKNFPLEVQMNELNGNEKYYHFNKKFPANDSRVGTIHTGDFMLYDSTYIVIFYKTFSTGYNYTRLGKIDNPEGLDKIVGGGNISVKFFQ